MRGLLCVSSSGKLEANQVPKPFSDLGDTE